MFECRSLGRYWRATIFIQQNELKQVLQQALIRRRQGPQAGKKWTQVWNIGKISKIYTTGLGEKVWQDLWHIYKPQNCLNQFHIINCSGWSGNKFTSIQNGRIRVSKGLSVTVIPWVTHENFCKELVYTPNLFGPKAPDLIQPDVHYGPAAERLRRP